MADRPIGISFLPSEDQAANGPMQGNAEGDLGQALKILSLHLPRVLGARAPVKRRLFDAPGLMGGGFNPARAVIKAILRTGGGGTNDMMGGVPMGTAPHLSFPQLAPANDPVEPMRPGGGREMKGPLHQQAPTAW